MYVPLLNIIVNATHLWYCIVFQVDCGVVRSGDQMLKCANCKTTIYCSRACQKEDWHEDDHKQSCGEYLGPIYIL